MSAVVAEVGGFYERHPYPPPVDDLEAYRRACTNERRRAESCLLWPGVPQRDDRGILVAGCGTVQAAHYAVRWPHAQVVGIDVSAASLAFARDLRGKHRLENLELYRLEVERAPELGRAFDCVVCTGVLHHLAEPARGLRALRAVLAPQGALQLMVYAPYGRIGVYLVQEYCRRLGIDWTNADLGALATTLKALSPDHPLVPLLRGSPDFSDAGAMADALLHPQDRSYCVPELMALLDSAGLAFGRWIRQAPYVAACGALASTPHRALLDTLSAAEQYAAIELFRGTMLRHALVAYNRGDGNVGRVDFDGGAWPCYVPVRSPDSIVVREHLPAGAVGVLVNRGHTFGDLYTAVDAREEALWAAIDGRSTIAELCPQADLVPVAREFFKQLWLSDHIVVDTTRGERS